MRRRKHIFSQMFLFACAVTFLSACSSTEADANLLRLSTTTSTYDSGLLSEIVPLFESAYDTQVEVIAVGSGQALALAANGDVDVVLAHAPSLELEFMEAGHGVERIPVMYNDFVLVGPIEDPVDISIAGSASEALTAVAWHGATFVSRGDNSGTHVKELELWAQTGVSPDETNEWYLSVGQGMGASLFIAFEENAYILTDRGTYLSIADNITGLKILFGGPSAYENPDPLLSNRYHIIAVNPESHPHVNHKMANAFIQWLTSPEIQRKIASFGLEQFGIPLFYPVYESSD